MTFKKPNKALIKKCDELWGLAVRGRDKETCQSCWRPGNNPHHIFGRRYHSVRHDLQNGITLCWACHHHKAHGDPKLFRDFIIKRMGQKAFNQLKVRTYAITKIDYNMRKIELELYLKEG